MGREIALTFFPLPYAWRGERHHGLYYEWSSRCESCDRQCEKSVETDVGLCSYGVNYCRINKDLLVAGIVLQDYPSVSPARQKMLRRTARRPTRAELLRARDLYRQIGADTARQVDDEKARIVEAYQMSGAYKHEVFERLQPKLKDLLTQIHDYRQFVSTVVQNMNVIVERRDQRAIPIEDKLLSASHEEAAIYWAARLLEERLQTSLFLAEPERIDDRQQWKVVRFHGCVTKYLRIYQRSFEQKRVHVEVKGESYASVRVNPVALGVIPQTLLDNALKYTPVASAVRVEFVEDESHVELVVGSYGPRLAASEKTRIFELFFRGEEAVRRVAEGTGYGLFLAQFIANKYGTSIEVFQDAARTKSGCVWTEFTVRWPREPKA